MKKSMLKVASLLLVISMLLVPSMANAKSSGNIGITDETISNSVKQIVAKHGPLTEPLVVDSGLIDPIDGFKIYHYIIPDNAISAQKSTDFSIMAVTPLSSHTIPQGTKMIYSKSNGDPWTVVTTTELKFEIYSANQTTATSLYYGHLNAATGSAVNSNTNDGIWIPAESYRYWVYIRDANATSVRFFIQNLSAADVTITGDITF